MILHILSAGDVSREQEMQLEIPHVKKGPSCRKGRSEHQIHTIVVLSPVPVLPVYEVENGVVDNLITGYLPILLEVP